MTFLSNIQSVAKYESKLLIRSWFFRVFTVLAIGITTLFNFLLFVSEDTYGFWIAMSIPSNIPYPLSNSAIAEYRTGCHCYFSCL